MQPYTPYYDGYSSSACGHGMNVPGSTLPLPQNQMYKTPATSLPKSTVFSKLLQKGPETKLPYVPSKTCGKVLTSHENILAIEKKE